MNRRVTWLAIGVLPDHRGSALRSASPDAQDFELSCGPFENADRLDNSGANWIIGPNTPVDKIDIVARMMRREERRSCGGRESRIERQLFVIAL